MLTDEKIRKIFLANGFTVKPGLTDLKAYVYEAAHAIESAACADRDARIAELERDLAEVRKDAERYRWLRDETEWEPFDSTWLNRNDIYGCPAQEMDVAIDAAMKGTP